VPAVLQRFLDQHCSLGRTIDAFVQAPSLNAS
jgi:hypothetical protein